MQRRPNQLKEHTSAGFSAQAQDTEQPKASPHYNICVLSSSLLCMKKQINCQSPRVTDMKRVVVSTRGPCRSVSTQQLPFTRNVADSESTAKRPITRTKTWAFRTSVSFLCARPGYRSVSVRYPPEQLHQNACYRQRAGGWNCHYILRSRHICRTTVSGATRYTEPPCHQTMTTVSNINSSRTMNLVLL